MSRWRKALKEPQPSEREITPPGGNIDIFHPYHDCLLLSFPAYALAQEAESELQYVVCYQLVMDACRIIANGAGRDPHLARKGDSTRVPDSTVDLRLGEYFFNLDTSEKVNYEIVTRFTAWNFPHLALPAHWQRNRTTQHQAELDSMYMHASASAMSDFVNVPGARCPVTNYDTGCATQNTHLVPESEVDWFTGNGMAQYGVGNKLQSGIDNVANGISLRADVRLILDNRCFVLFPADDSFVVHIIRHNTNYTELMHWRQVLIPERVSTEFLYARFAYTVIGRIPDFTRLVVKQVEVSAKVREAKQRRLQLASLMVSKDSNKRKFSQIGQGSTGAESGTNDTSSASGSSQINDPMVVDDQFYATLEQHWKKQLTEWHPELAEEYPNPPEARNDFHSETPRMLKLASEYFRNNPQVWQTSQTPPGSERWDAEAQEARLMSIPFGLYKTPSRKATSQPP